MAARTGDKIAPPANGAPTRLTSADSYHGTKKRLHRPTRAQAFLLVRRFFGLIAAIYCVFTSTNSGWWSIYTLFGTIDSTSTYVPYRAKLIQHFLGSATIKESRLAGDLLSGDTSPRSYTAYIESNSSISRTGCSKVTKFNKDLYGDAFVRSNFNDFVTLTAYNLTFLDDYELVLPVVDCSFSSIQVGDSTVARVYYIVRQRMAPSEIAVFMLSMSTQDFQLPSHHQLGSTIFVVLTVIDDMQATVVPHYAALGLGYPFEGPRYQVYNFVQVTKEGFVVLESVPIDPTTERTKRVLTANRSGFFIGSEQSQSNVKNLHWKLLQDPIMAVTVLEWVGTTVLQNGWGWMRFVDFVFAFDTTFNILVLLLVIYRNYQRGKIWIGDAFISFSRTLLLRGAAIVLIWLMEGFWTLLTFALADGNSLGDGIGVFSFEEIIHGDLLTLYISLAGLLGYILNERINPALVVVLFELGYQCRLGLVAWFPSTVANKIIAYSQTDYLRGMAALPPELTGFSPFLYWSIHPLEGNTAASFAALLPVFSTFLLLLIYAPMRKVIRWYQRPRSQRSRPYRLSERETVHKSSLTVFELATGAALQNRVGLVSDYDSCVFIKGLKFASADGIYCNGFVIANGKWLIRTGDLLWVILMVLTRVRLRDLYVYEVEEHTVNQTARLVYPDMMSLSDLLQLNTTLLA